MVMQLSCFCQTVVFLLFMLYFKITNIKRIMANKEKSTARDVFFYLLMIVTLYVGVVSFLTLLFQFTNLWFPDPLDYFSASYESIRFSTAALFVVWPVFIFMSWAIERDMKKAAGKKQFEQAV